MWNGPNSFDQFRKRMVSAKSCTLTETIIELCAHRSAPFLCTLPAFAIGITQVTKTA